MRELRLLSSTGVFGVTPFVDSAIFAGLEGDPRFIGVARSIDLGP